MPGGVKGSDSAPFLDLETRSTARSRRMPDRLASRCDREVR
uniref:Uncharacterized protein n=1 Tax=Bursaphelenchus xylophilus TaxID=6326 RepID=A0A1I7SIZ9_BURXY